MLLLGGVGVAGKLAKEMEAQMLTALANARDAVDKGTANTQLLTWFGIADPGASKAMLKRRLSFMRSHINNTPISFSLTGDSDPNNNADAIPFNLKGGAGQDTYAKYQALQNQNASISIKKGTDNLKDEAVVRLGKNFKNLPDYGTNPLSTFDGQDKFETLVHELSHVILGTEDEKLSNGATAYGAVAARELATTNAGKAINNAENWGFFVEEFRA